MTVSLTQPAAGAAEQPMHLVAGQKTMLRHICLRLNRCDIFPSVATQHVVTMRVIAVMRLASKGLGCLKRGCLNCAQLCVLAVRKVAMCAGHWSGHANLFV